MGPLTGLESLAFLFCAGTALALASLVRRSLIWFSFAAASYALPWPPHPQLVAYCYFKEEAHYHAVTLSWRAKIHLLATRETLLPFPRIRRQ